jgi:hypothetical protein
MTGNSWNEWSNHILLELKELSEGQKEQTESISRLREEIVVERAKLREEIACDRTNFTSAIEKHDARLGTHTWFMRLLVGGMIMASLTGMFGAVQSCRIQEAQAQRSVLLDAEEVPVPEE